MNVTAMLSESLVETEYSKFLADIIAAGMPADVSLDVLKAIPFEELRDALEKADLGKNNAIAIYLLQQWILSHRGAPQTLRAWFSLALAETEVKNFEAAIAAYHNVIEISPEIADTYLNLGITYKKAKNLEAALEIWQKAIPLTEDPCSLLNHCGGVLSKLKRYDEAVNYFQASLDHNPSQADTFEQYVNLLQNMCRWDDVKNALEVFGCNNLSPFSALSLFDDITLQRHIAEKTINRRTSPSPKFLSPPEGYSHDKIRVGYMSSDFNMHAMSYLIAELFEKHDRNHFEIYGYCNSLNDESALRDKVVSSFDHFTSIVDMYGKEAAELIRRNELDILVDLNGITDGFRDDVLRYKPAPVQMTYLGYVGPVPLPELDYMLCDDYIVPSESVDLYVPKPLSLGGVYQANDARRDIPPPPPREEAGLPSDSFIFCCHARPHKITEVMFTAWMDILRQSDNSILWLSVDNPWSKENLERAAEDRGINSDRLLFTPPVALTDYLSRLALADLFLDTSPYNSGTVASDALRRGLPLLTLEGKCFSARMAGSLLTTVGLSDLIAPDMESYVRKAVQLSRDRAMLEGYRSVLQGGETWKRTLGDTANFTKRIEAAFRSVVKRGS